MIVFHRVFFLFFLLTGIQQLYAQTPDSVRTKTDEEAITQDSTERVDKRKLRKERKAKEKAKEDTTDTKPKIYKDSARLALEALTKKAATRSAILPGWGQLFNKGWGYVKAPIVWAGFGGLGYSYVFAQDNYHETLAEVQQRVQNQDIPLNPKYINANTEWLINAKDFYRRNRDLTLIISVGWYALNIIDAYIDAKFKRYDMSDDLSFRIRPTLIQVPNNLAYSQVPAVGLKATFSIK